MNQSIQSSRQKGAPRRYAKGKAKGSGNKEIILDKKLVGYFSQLSSRD